MISRSTMYKSLASAIDSLPPKKAKRFSVAVLEYIAENKEPSFEDSALRAVWIVAKDLIDRVSDTPTEGGTDTPCHTPSDTPCHTPSDTPTEGGEK